MNTEGCLPHCPDPGRGSGAEGAGRYFDKPTFDARFIHDYSRVWHQTFEDLPDIQYPVPFKPPLLTLHFEFIEALINAGK